MVSKGSLYDGSLEGIANGVTPTVAVGDYSSWLLTWWQERKQRVLMGTRSGYILERPTLSYSQLLCPKGSSTSQNSPTSLAPNVQTCKPLIYMVHTQTIYFIYHDFLGRL